MNKNEKKMVGVELDLVTVKLLERLTEIDNRNRRQLVTVSLWEFATNHYPILAASLRKQPPLGNPGPGRAEALVGPAGP